MSSANEKSKKNENPTVSNDNVTNNDNTIDVFDTILSTPTDEILPWENVQLPSKGLFYDGMIPDGMIQIRPMDVIAEKFLATTRLVRSGQAIDKLFSHCIKFPNEGFDPLDLLSGDGTFLLFYLRGITYGNNYEFTVTCSDEDCNHTMVKDFDLNQLADTIKGPDTEYTEEPFTVPLPYMSKRFESDVSVQVRMVRRRDIINISSRPHNNTVVTSKRAKMNKFRKYDGSPLDNLNDLVERNLERVIVSVMGNTDRRKIAEFVKKLSSSDASEIREFLDRVSPGIDPTIYVKCDKCGNEMNIALPMSESFFRRTVRRGDGE